MHISKKSSTFAYLFKSNIITIRFITQKYQLLFNNKNYAIMEFRLNLFLQNFGNNSLPCVKFICHDPKEVQQLIIGYKPVLRRFEIFKYEYEEKGDTWITKRTQIGLTDDCFKSL